MNKLTLFGSPTCVLCQTLKLRLNNEGTEFEYVDVFENPELAGENGIMSTPTLLYGEERAVGLGAGNELLDRIKG